MTENREMLKNRDYTLIIDKSGSMAITDEDDEKVKNELEMKTRWELMEESSIALASKCEKLDPDGITVYTFSTNFKGCVAKTLKGQKNSVSGVQIMQLLQRFG